MKKSDASSISRRAVEVSRLHKFCDQEFLDKLGPESPLGLAIVTAQHADDLCSFLPKWQNARRK